MRGGLQGGPGGPGVSGGRGSRGVHLGGKTAKNQKNLLLAYYAAKDFVQEVPVGQMAQGTAFQGVRRG